MSDAGSGSKVTCSIRLEFPDRATAENVHKSVELDNAGYVDAKLDGTAIVANIGAQSLNSLLHTLDDFLSCTSVAERVVVKKP